MANFDEIINYSPENQNVFEELLAFCRNNMIVPYIGAGMSVFAGFSIPNLKNRNLFPTWTDLIGTKYSEYFKDKKLPKDLIDAADEIEKAMGRKEFYEYIRVTMGGDLNEEWTEILKEAENQAIYVVPKLFFCPMVTTNFDQIIEKIYSKDISVSFPYHTENLKQAIDERKQLLYKIHGCVSDAQNIVLAKSKYDEVYNPESDLVKSLSQFCQGFHFLFLGCSLTINNNDGTTDYSTKLLLNLQGKSKMPHYAILPCEKDKMSDRRIELEKRNIYPIFYEDVNKKHEEVKIILDNLKDEIKNQLFQIPKYDKPYTERKENIIVKIKSNLEKSRYSVLAIRGDAGVGKTRIIREYALQSGKRFFWFSAISADNVKEEIRKFVVKYQNIFEEETDTNTIFQAFKKWTKENENYLFLLDNVENFEDIKIFLENDFSTLAGTRHILITSRLSKKELNNIQTEEVKVFEKEDARNFFKSHTDTEKYNEEYADKIASLLGNLPLALEQATAIIQSNEKETYKKFYEELEKESFRKLEKRHPEHGAVPVAATWNMAMQRINSDAAKELLWLCAYFAPDKIKEQWFLDAFEVLPENLKNNIQIKLAEIEDQLKKYSLVDIDNGKISIHRLLQEVIRKTIAEQEKWIEYGINILHKQIFENFLTAQSRISFTEIVPHINSLLIKHNEAQVEVADLYHFLGFGYNELGNYAIALSYLNKSLTIQRRIFKKATNSIAITLHNIARVYYRQSEYQSALFYYKKSLNCRKKLNDNSDSNQLYIADTYNNIALTNDDFGYYRKALIWYKKSLTIRKKIVGENSVEVADSYQNIALTYHDQKKYKKALILYKESLLIYDKVAKKHLNRASLFNNMGLTYYELNNFVDAMKCYRKSLNIRKKVLGEEHPETSTNYNNIGLLYSQKGKYSIAMKWYIKCLNIRLKKLGENHTRTAGIYHNIAKVYDGKNEYQKSLDYFILSYKIFISKLNDNHSSVIKVKDNMKQTYFKTNSSIPFDEWLNEQLKASVNNYTIDR